MKQLLLNKPNTVLVALALAVLSTLAYDFVPRGDAKTAIEHFFGAIWLERVLFAIALPLRIFTYAVLVFSFPLLAAHLNGQRKRLGQISATWLATGLLLMSIVWCWMVFGDSLGQDPAVKRMSPDTMWDADWTMAQVALGKEKAKSYTWSAAIITEILALGIITTAVAVFTWRVGQSKSPNLAFLTPAIPVLLLVAYVFLAPWALVFDFDIFIGDALLGATLLNALLLPATLVFGGFSAPATWVGMIAATNVFFIRSSKSDKLEFQN